MRASAEPQRYAVSFIVWTGFCCGVNYLPRSSKFEKMSEALNISSGLFIILLIIIMVFVPIVLSLCFKEDGKSKDSSIKPAYRYRAKHHIMTKREERFFEVLCQIFENKCYIVPQVHLSALLEHRIKGQNWQGAFRHINGKSVDYILLRHRDLSVLCAVELDDVTHETTERISRDNEVERIFREVSIPLVRLRTPERMSKQEIVDHFVKVINDEMR